MLRFLTAGESHGRGLVGIIESFPAGFEISIEGVNHQLSRRQAGYGRGKRMRIENDRVTILSGLRHGRTLGSPISILIENKDWPNWKDAMDEDRPIRRNNNRSGKPVNPVITTPRPGHADLAGGIKFHTHDLRNVVERASARETAARVACVAIARQLLEYFDIRIVSHVLAIGKTRLRQKRVNVFDIMQKSDSSPVRCIDLNTSERMIAEIKKALDDGDTLGGLFEVRAVNLPAGLGSPAQWSTRLDGELAEAIMSIPSVKAVEIGDGFESGRKRGSQVHDRIYFESSSASIRSKHFVRRTNSAGGIEGGMTNGEELVIRGACKPIATLLHPLDSVDILTKSPAEGANERSDVCIVPSAAVVGEAMVALVLASAFTDKFGHDSRTEIEANFRAYLEREF